MNRIYLHFTNMTTVDTTLFDNFGKVTYDQLSQGFSNLITDVTFCDDKYKLLSDVCDSILKGRNNYNLLILHNLLFHLTNQNAKNVDNIIINIFTSYTQDIHKQISNQIKSATFKIKSFIDLYNLYYKNAQCLSKQITYFDSRVYCDGSNKYSHVNMIRSYMFYKNVINTKYSYIDGKEYYIYEIFTKSIESGDVSINEILQLFKMYSFYIKLSYVAKTNRDTLFNLNINKLFLVTLGADKTFIKTIIQYINNTLKTLYNKEDKSEADNICELIGLVSNHFLEKEMFNMYYENLMETRLLNGEFDPVLERKLINKFKRPVDNKIIQNMIYKLEDMEACKADKVLYDKLEISVTSDKYKGKIDTNKFNPKMINAKLFRYYAWSQSKEADKGDLTIPFEAAPYIDIYNKFYQLRYPYREVYWNFNYGIGTVKMTLAGKEYFLQLTTPQMFLLLQFNHAQEITAIDLAKNLGSHMPMSKLGPILNTFIKADILHKEAGKQSNDPTMKIYLNPNFSYNNNKISLVNSMVISLQQKQQPIVDKEIAEKFTIGRDTVLQAHIIKAIKQKQHITFVELLECVKITVPFQFVDSKFIDVVKTCINEKYIKVNPDLTYDYLVEEEEDE